MLMVASVNETQEDEIGNDTNFQWNKMLVKQKVIGIFKEKCKNLSAKQESVSEAAFKA